MTGPYRSRQRDGRARLQRVQKDVRTISAALTSVRPSDADAASLLHTAAIRLEAEAAHLRTIAALCANPSSKHQGDSDA